MKNCTKCLELLPLCDFYKKAIGVSSKCKKCTCNDHKAKRAAVKVIPENEILAKDNLRRCSVCKDIKSNSEFYKKKNSFEGFCKSCKNSKCKIRNENDPTYKDRSTATRKEFFKNNPDIYQEKLEYSRNYYQNNKKKHHEWVRVWYKKHPGKSYEYFRKWRLANLDVSTYHAQKRRAAKLQATPSWAISEELEIKEIYKKCAEMTSGGTKHNVDHIVPLQSDFVCGLHCLANLQILTASENSSKNNFYWPDMW